MATERRINCRTHPGGKFIAPVRRGRPPVRCDEGFRCTAYETAIVPAKNKPKTAAGKELIKVGTDEGPTATRARLQGKLDAKRARPVDEVHTEIEIDEPKASASWVKDRDASLAKAKKAKAELHKLGWTVEGKAKDTRAEITAVRDEEMLYMVWEKGVLTTSQYSLWSTDRPRENGMPASELPEDVNLDEMTDREIVAALAGCKVTWWNRLGQLKETAVMSTKQICIEHVYDEKTIASGAQPSERTIKFVDHNGGGYKAFRLGALLKIG